MKIWEKSKARRAGRNFVGIPVYVETKERLDRIATKTDTYDSFVNRLLDAYERRGVKK